MKNGLILFVSNRMESNKKETRHENELIRIGSIARKNLGLENDSVVELFPDGDGLKRATRSRILKIFEAYAEDLKRAKEELSTEQYQRVGFVTQKTFNFLCGSRPNNRAEDIWLADSIEDTIIGADPEFLLRSEDGTPMYAGNVPGFTYEGSLGSDGPLAEVRPNPEVSPTNMIKNIRQILNSDPNIETIKNYKWEAACFYNAPDLSREFSIGGHIHIGTPLQISQFIINKLPDDFTNKTLLFSNLQKLIDEYVAIPLIKLDGKENTIKRRNHYGTFGDFRSDGGRLEYRTISGMWLLHPKIATAVVGTVKAISDSYFKLIEQNNYDTKLLSPSGLYNMYSISLFSKSTEDGEYGDRWKTIEILKHFDATKSSDRMIDILHKGNIALNRPFFDKLTKKLEKLSEYNKYKEHIESFITILSNSYNKLSNLDRDIKHNWVEDKDLEL